MRTTSFRAVAVFPLLSFLIGEPSGCGSTGPTTGKDITNPQPWTPPPTVRMAPAIGTYSLRVYRSLDDPTSTVAEGTLNILQENLNTNVIVSQLTILDKSGTAYGSHMPGCFGPTTSCSELLYAQYHIVDSVFTTDVYVSASCSSIASGSDTLVSVRTNENWLGSFQYVLTRRADLYTNVNRTYPCVLRPQ